MYCVVTSPTTVGHRSENRGGNRRGVAAGARLDGVIAFIARLREIAADVLIGIGQRIFDASAGLLAQPHQIRIAVAGESRLMRGDPVDSHQITLRQFQHLIERL